MIEVGKLYKAKVVEASTNGFFVQEVETKEKVFMPNRMTDGEFNKDELIEVFIYKDTKGQLTASEDLPFAIVGEYARMRVKEVQDFGAFFHWGIDKDLLVPGNQQKIKVNPGEYHLVRVCIEDRTDRIYGTTKLGRWIESSEFDIEEKDKVYITPVQETDLGYRVIINKKFIGMIYHSEIFKTIIPGNEYEAVVKKIREDGLVDCALQIQGIKNLDAATVTIMQMLKKRGGFSPLHDKSSPEEIQRSLAMSKKTFKSAIGMLYKRKKIIISEDGIKLTKK
ncbi:MAG: S1-like domain-containing RNA-binding protein [Bacteriovoracaceae bacterium]|jgi:predicted RNA-binding protein (virulence factor B family)|nr:S1-like domain-containing RNA-binding protein [Bacteriovoracaceae bacterium]